MGLVVGCPLSSAPIGGIALFVSNFGAVGSGLLVACLCSADLSGAGRAGCPALGAFVAGTGPSAVPGLIAGIAGAVFGPRLGAGLEASGCRLGRELSFAGAAAAGLGTSVGFCGATLVAGAGAGFNEGAGVNAGAGAGAGPSAGF